MRANMPSSMGSIAPREDQHSFLLCVFDHCATEQAQANGWSIEHQDLPEQRWIVMRNSRARRPEQGWKIHVSAGLPFAKTILRLVLPVLLVENAEFKVAASPERLAALNRGEYGLSQIGKFITVYPNDDDQAVRLAIALDEATRGLRGPAIPSDRPLVNGSLVHYRYGGFRDRVLQTLPGAVFHALVTPEGKRVPDERRERYQPPDWAIDPFLAAGVATYLPPPTVLVGNRYLMLNMLSSSARGGVVQAIDIITKQQCVLKWARRDAVMQTNGRDARDRLRWEERVLRLLDSDPHFPHVLDLIEQDNDLYLVMEEVQGQTLAEYIANLAIQGQFVSESQVVSWGQQLATILAALHHHGFIYRDLKPQNIMVTSDGILRLIDFDIVYDMQRNDQSHRGGTPGYMSPQQASGQAAAISDDIYSLGAVLYFLVTNADPVLTPWETIPHDRPIRLLNPLISERLAQIIHQCLEPDPPQRFATTHMLNTELAITEHYVHRATTATEEEEENLQSYFGDLARRLGDTLCQTARRSPNGIGVLWRNTEGVGDIECPNIYQGSAGIVLVLAELADVFQESLYYETISDAAQWLVHRSQAQEFLNTGLYTGEAGIGAAILRAGQVLNDQALIAAAIEQGQRIANFPYISPDLMSGAAGRLRYHLLLWDQTGASESLRHAIEAGSWLLATAEEAANNGIYWSVPLDQQASQKEVGIVGYAHGAAGIADALLDLFEATKDERFYIGAQHAARWVAQQALPALNDKSGLIWPKIMGEGPTKANWASGATGIGRFLLHAAQGALLPEASELAAGAARTIDQGARWHGPTQAYGLAGHIEFLLDMFQFTGQRSYLSGATQLARILEAFKLEQDARLLWRGYSRQPLDASYMCGYAGVAACLLRLSMPETAPHLMSRQGFQHRQCNEHHRT